jgi:hypothetical protein
VVIPALAESRRLFQTLESLAGNPPDELQATLVLCVVNNREAPHASDEEIRDNQLTLRRLRRVIADCSAATPVRALRLAVIDASSPGFELRPREGVGSARRIGLDRGLEVLCRSGSTNGLLISLDADTVVETSYLREIQGHFDRVSTGAAVVGYAHRQPECARRRRAILLYEVFLRYHELGLRRAGSPYAIPTIGSTIVARADAYVAAGGMNRKQAGEDFYFLQQLVKTSEVSRIDSATVFPAARASSRVPFGTGASVGQFLGGSDELHTAYNPKSYEVLGQWLGLIRRGLGASADELMARAREVAPELGVYLHGQSFSEVWPKLKRNARDHNALASQFHRWFDGFKSLKMLHHLRDNGWPSVPVETGIAAVCGVERPGAMAGTAWLETVLEKLRRQCREGSFGPATVRMWEGPGGSAGAGGCP